MGSEKSLENVITIVAHHLSHSSREPIFVLLALVASSFLSTVIKTKTHLYAPGRCWETQNDNIRDGSRFDFALKKSLLAIDPASIAKYYDIKCIWHNHIREEISKLFWAIVPNDMTF
jgi:hypothetical protein